MKPSRHAIVFAAGLFFLWAMTAPCAEGWHTIDGGGGTSTGGSYAVSGTVGQEDASGAMTGGAFSLSGGFWAILAVLEPESPLLSILKSGPNEATIAWSPNAPGWVLQASHDLTSGTWSNTASTTNNPARITITQPGTYYRVHKP